MNRGHRSRLNLWSLGLFLLVGGCDVEKPVSAGTNPDRRTQSVAVAQSESLPRPGPDQETADPFASRFATRMDGSMDSSPLPVESERRFVEEGPIREASGEPQFRTWRSKDGHSVRALLVKHSDYEIYLKTDNGRQLRLDKTVFSPADLEYAGSHSSLRVDEPPQKLPWVKVSAVMKSWGREFGEEEDDGTVVSSRKRSMAFKVANIENRPLEIELVWFFVKEGILGRMRTTGADDLETFKERSAELTLGPKEDFEFRTDDVRTTQMTSSGGFRSGNKIAGFCIQAYWNGYLVDHFASDPICRHLAEDETFYGKFRDRRIELQEDSR